MKMRLILVGCTLLLGALGASGSNALADAYFAPVNNLVFRLTLPGGVTQDFTACNPKHPERFVSSDGWKALLGANGKITVRPPSGEVTAYVFDRGRLVSVVRGKSVQNFAYDQPRKPLKGAIPPLATFEIEDSYFEKQRQREDAMRWGSTGRLCFPYSNPNLSGALYALLFLVALSFVFGSRRSAQILAAVAAAAFLGLMLWTGSRGAILGAFFGTLAIFSVRAKALIRSRRFWLLAGAVLLALGAVVGIWQRKTLTRGFSSQGVGWSNAIRLEMWKTTPKMMFDAPSGWKFCGAGRAYVDWYQPPPGNSITGSLMNDHLTTLVELGWTGRFGYLTVSLLLLLLCGRVLVARHHPLPLALWLAFAVMAWFNPIFGAWGLWILPVAASWELATLFRHGVRGPCICAAISSLAAGLVTGALYMAGSAQSNSGGLRIRVDGRRVLCKTSRPKIWIVDDRQGALGGLFAGQDIRAALLSDPATPSVGYVREVADLPKDGVERLVLAGKAATDWMVLLSENPEARTRLPKSVLLITPSFAPSDIPEGALKCTDLRVLVGEFAARYQPEYANPPPYVVIAKGMERYVLGWMRFVLGG